MRDLTDEEIRVWISHLEHAARSEISTPPRIWWGFSALFTLPVFVPQVGPVSGLAAGLLAFIAWSVSQESRANWQNFERERALSLWSEWTRREGGEEVRRGLVKTAVMRDEILDIYKADPRGEVLPLRQSMRLINTYGRQEERLEQIADHLAGVEEIRVELLEKTAQLRELGEETEDVQAILRGLERDIVPLETSVREIRASCYRLEFLLISVKKALQIKRLRSEIQTLASVETSSDEMAIAQTTADTIDIERQITREVETFLQLERDSDRHLRDL